MSRTLMMLALGAGASFPALAEPPEVMQGKLVDEHKMTLYVFDKDTAAGKSACNGTCATNWPPALADSYDKASGDWSFITRDDGKRQWAYKGHPLYRWSKDQKPGDTTGDGVIGAWHVARP